VLLSINYLRYTFDCLFLFLDNQMRKKHMKMLSCKNMGADDGFVAKGSTDEEVMGKMMKHAREKHADKMSGMSDEEMREMMKGKIKDDDM
jgi:predicted small metal-binding protein